MIIRLAYTHRWNTFICITTMLWAAVLLIYAVYCWVWMILAVILLVVFSPLVVVWAVTLWFCWPATDVLARDQ